jgi:hypothetical protein
MTNNNSLARSLLLAGVVAAGVAAAWCAVVLWSGSLLSRTMQTAEVHEQLYTDADGEPVIVRTSRSSNATESAVSLTGEARKVTAQELLHPLYSYEYGRIGGGWQQRIRSANDGGLPATYWYIVHDGQSNGRAYGVAFHSRKKTIVGYFSRQGFSDVLPPRDEWFQVPGDKALTRATTLQWGAQEPIYAGGTHPFLLLADGKLWRIDVAHKELKSILDCPQAQGIGSVWEILADRPPVPKGAYPPSAQEVTPQLGLVRQPDSVLVVDPMTGKSTPYPLPADLRDSMLAATLEADGRLLLFGAKAWGEPEYDVVWMAPSGEVAKQRHVRLTQWNYQPSLTVMGWWGALAVPMTSANVAFQALLPQMLVESKKADSYSAGLATALATNWPSMIVMAFVSLASAIATYRRQRRYGLRHAVAWAVFAYLFGIPGWIAYRFHRAWPVLEECPACHQPSPRDREHCLDCGVAFPPPPLKGIEVFA